MLLLNKSITFSPIDKSASFSVFTIFSEFIIIFCLFTNSSSSPSFNSACSISFNWYFSKSKFLCLSFSSPKFSFSSFFNSLYLSYSFLYFLHNSVFFFSWCKYYIWFLFVFLALWLDNIVQYCYHSCPTNAGLFMK